MEPAIPFAEDHRAQIYDAAANEKSLAGICLCVHKVFLEFRARFCRESAVRSICSGVRFDLAVTRFSGRKAAPEHPGGMPNMPLKVMQEAYSHEVSSAGFWPGGDDFPQPVFYSYCYPTPESFGKQSVQPEAAFYSDEMGEFFLSYSEVQSSDDPEATLMRFLETTYKAAAVTGNWDPKLEVDFSDYEVKANESN